MDSNDTFLLLLFYLKERILSNPLFKNLLKNKGIINYESGDCKENRDCGS